MLGRKMQDVENQKRTLKVLLKEFKTKGFVPNKFKGSKHYKKMAKRVKLEKFDKFSRQANFVDLLKTQRAEVSAFHKSMLIFIF